MQLALNQFTVVRFNEGLPTILFVVSVYKRVAQCNRKYPPKLSGIPMSKKKKDQLGMHPSTASNRLQRDIIWDFIVKTDQTKCHRCGLEMSREDYSIEHKEPWLDSEDPVELFFNLDNISYSHQKCNYGAARKYTKVLSE